MSEAGTSTGPLLAPSERLRVGIALNRETFVIETAFARMLLAEIEMLKSLRSDEFAAHARAEAGPVLDAARALLRRVRREALTGAALWLLSLANVVLAAWLAGWFG